MKQKTIRIVCLGGGIGTATLLSGLKKYNTHLTAITSMADDGGSSGKLRKQYNIMPPGDLVSCIAALVENKELAALLTHRFKGNTTELSGHKLGNLIMLAQIQRTGDFYKALEVTKKIFGVEADILPATDEKTSLSAVTKDGRTVHTETTLDLALYSACKSHYRKDIIKAGYAYTNCSDYCCNTSYSCNFTPDARCRVREYLWWWR